MLHHMRYLKSTLTILVIVVFIFIARSFGWTRAIEQRLFSLFVPLSGQFYAMQANNIELPYDSFEEFRQSYAQLQEEVVRMKAVDSRNKVLVEENAALLAQLRYAATSSAKLLGARVVGKDVDPLSSNIIVDLGQDHGVSVGQAVVALDGVLVGQVIAVEQKRSVVRLLNDTRSKVAARTLNQDKSIGLIEGGFGISVKLTYVPQNELLQVGDAIVTSGLSEHIPKGLYIGKVEAIEREAYQPFQTAVVRPAVAYEKLTNVAIIE